GSRRTRLRVTASKEAQMSSPAEKPERRCMAPQMPSEVIPQKTYAFIYAPGPQWLVGRPVTEQNLEAHCAYMGDLYARGQVPLGGLFVDDAGGGFALVRAKGRGEAMALLAADPALREGGFTGRVRRRQRLLNGPMGAARSQVRSNKRAVRALFEAVDHRDGEGVRAGYDENITIHEAASLPYGGDYRGLEGALRHGQGFRATWDRFQPN